MPPGTGIHEDSDGNWWLLDDAGERTSFRMPRGGFYFVFQAGVPMFRKYDGGGRLVFERHIEGVELDRAIAGLTLIRGGTRGA